MNYMPFKLCTEDESRWLERDSLRDQEIQQELERMIAECPELFQTDNEG